MASEKKLEVGHDWAANMWDWPLQHNDGVVKVTNTAQKFEVGLEVHFFTPKEIEVKVIGDELLVNCQHEERTDTHGRITRQIHRAYKLPADVDCATLKSHLSAKGVLVINADKKK